MCILLIRLYYKEVRMSDPKNGGTNSKDRGKPINESDQGASIRRPMGDTAIGQNPESTRKPPKPPHNPHK